jgi:hypothetical protein
VGIDVSKAQFDVAVRPAGEHWTSAHTEAGITTLVARLVSLRPTLVVLEATGGFEISLTGAWAVFNEDDTEVTNPYTIFMRRSTCWVQLYLGHYQMA